MRASSSRWTLAQLSPLMPRAFWQEEYSSNTGQHPAGHATSELHRGDGQGAGGWFQICHLPGQGRVLQPTNNDQGWGKFENESSMNSNEACRMYALQAGLMETLGESMAPALLGRNISNVTTFSYPAFKTSHLILNQVLTRSCRPSHIPNDALVTTFTSGGIFHYDNEEDRPQDPLINAISSLVGTCLDPVQDFWEPLHLPCFRMKLAPVHVSSPASELEGHASLLQVHLEAPEPVEAELEGPSPELPPAPEPEQEPAPALVPPPVLELTAVSPPSVPQVPEPGPTSAPAPAPAPELDPAGPLSPGRILTPSGERTSEPDPAPEPTCPRAVTTKSLLWEQKPDSLGFLPQLIADQFTVMDAGLFKQVMPRHCLDSIWSPWDNRGNEHLAPTICATVTQFITVVNCVVTTCLGDLSMTAQDRARVVELWIQGARECQSVRNSASLRAILSALQSHTVHQLKKTWVHVSRRQQNSPSD
nr:ral guanine nucleotide dissociation stimulator-like isoform X2 [Equus caballus]XP_023501283.1 ral guanine nucleotide dissociation stimulator-like isoform X2 [Equus caballus]